MELFSFRFKRRICQKYGSAENTPNIYDKKFIEQVRTIAKILNEKVTTDGLHNNLKYLRNAGLLNLGDLVCALRDNNGEIADTTIESIKKIISRAKNVGELPQYLSCLKDKDGNIDPKKANAFCNYYLYNDSLEATSDFIIKAFSDNQQVNYVDEISKVRSALYNSDSDLENLSPTTYQDIIFAMVNKKGEIPEETIEFLKNLLDMKKEADAQVIPEVFHAIKDDNGNLDPQKKSTFLCYYSWNYTSLDNCLTYLKEEHE